MADAQTARPLRGLALPAIRTAGGYFVSKGPVEVTWGDLVMAAFVPIGSRPMSRSFGGSLHQVVFEPNDPLVDQAIDGAIREAVAAWAPHVRIVDILVGRGGNRVGVTIRFAVAGDSQVQVRNVLISQSDVVNFLAASRA